MSNDLSSALSLWPFILSRLVGWRGILLCAVVLGTVGIVFVRPGRHPAPLLAFAPSPPAAFDQLRGDYELTDGRHVFVGRFGAQPLFYQDGDTAWFLRAVDDTRYTLAAGGEVTFERDPAGQGSAITIHHDGAPPVRGTREHLYQEHDIQFANGATTLHGTLLLPAGNAPHPAIVLIHGSGHGDRENLRNLAAHFARAGIAALIYDKRSDYSPTAGRRSYSDLANDALAAVALLKHEPRVDAAHIGLWGISEGGWIAPLAATRTSDVAFVIPVSATGVIPLQQEVWLEENNLRHGGIDAAVVDTMGKAWRLIADAQRLPLPQRTKDDVYLLSDAHYDPVPTLAHVQQPVLALYGSNDTDIPPAESAAILQATLERAVNNQYTIRFFAGADHQLLLSPDGYSYPSTTHVQYAPGYLDAMTTWIWQVVDGTLERGGRVVGDTPVQARTSQPVTQVPWYGSVFTQLAVMLGCATIFCLQPLIGVVAWIRRPRRTVSAPRVVRVVARFTSSVGMLLVIGLIGFLVFVLLNAGRGLDHIGGRPLPWIVLQVLAMLHVALTVSLLVMLALPRTQAQLHGGSRIHYVLVALAAVVLLPWMLYWNLLPS